MAASSFLDVCRFNPSAGGTTDWTYSSAVTGYQSPSAAGVVNGAQYSYRAESSDLSQWEVGIGTYNTSTGVLSRTTVLFNSSGTTAKISFSGVPQVAIVAIAEDLLSFNGANSFTAVQRAQARANISAPLRGHIAGLVLSTAGSSATFGIAAGEASDSTVADLMVLGSAYTKTTSAWAVGSGSGALDTGTIANSTWYHVHLIKRADTGVVDVLVSASATSPTMPTNYTLSRRIGSMKTDGSAHWVKFLQIDDDFFWSAPVNDVAGQTATAATPVSFSLASIPASLKLKVKFNATANLSGNTCRVRIYDPDLGDNNNATSITLGNSIGGASSIFSYVASECYCDSTQHIRMNAQDTSTVNVWVTGWVDTRGRFA